MVPISPLPLTPGQIYEYFKTRGNKILFVFLGSLLMTLLGVVAGLMLTAMPSWVGLFLTIVTLAMIFMVWRSVLVGSFGSFHWVSALWITVGFAVMLAQIWL